MSNENNNGPMRTRSKYTYGPRENACKQVAIGFGFASDWLRRRDARFLNQSQNVEKQNQFRITFDTQLKIALKRNQSNSAITFDKLALNAYFC